MKINNIKFIGTRAQFSDNTCKTRFFCTEQAQQLGKQNVEKNNDVTVEGLERLWYRYPLYDISSINKELTAWH